MLVGAILPGKESTFSKMNKSLASARMADKSFLEHPSNLYGTTYNLTPRLAGVQGIEFLTSLSNQRYDVKIIAGTLPVIMLHNTNFGAHNCPILGAIELKFSRDVSLGSGSRRTKFSDDSLKFSYTFSLNSKLWGP